MKKFVLFSLVLLAFLNSSLAQVVRLQYETSPQEAYAADVLKKSLAKNGYIINNNGKPDYTISLKLNSATLSEEAYALRLEGKNITIEGGDGSGVIYGALSIAEDLANGIPLEKIKRRSE
ncbi:MAG TPA: glycoside hydrolase family 20 zincin-like fold domain-containing protein, partial [Chryseolinea sp.]|nr:glycoside hydrolase family 20 zincin-like fold domain-containing protein [Chryseolinea sp.]